MHDDSRPGRAPLRFHVEHSPPPAQVAPDHCAECGCNSVPCPRCVDDDEVPIRYPMTDQVRVITHVGICPEHGAIAQRCANRTHFAKPLLEYAEEAEVDMGLIRAVSIALIAGLIGGCVLGIFAIAPLILAR